MVIAALKHCRANSRAETSLSNNFIFWPWKDLQSKEEDWAQNGSLSPRSRSSPDPRKRMIEIDELIMSGRYPLLRNHVSKSWSTSKTDWHFTSKSHVQIDQNRTPYRETTLLTLCRSIRRGRNVLRGQPGCQLVSWELNLFDRSLTARQSAAHIFFLPFFG